MEQAGKKSSVMKYVIVILVALGLTAIAVISLIRERIVNPNINQLTVTASGVAYAKPDIAQISVAVQTNQVKEASQAVQENTEKMNQVIAQIKAAGVEEKDIKTTNYSLTPNYRYNPETGESTVDGYNVYQEITVKIRDLSKVGEIIETSTSVGANQVGSISFTIDDTENIKKEAREEAIAKAKIKVRDLTELTGIKIGKLVNVYESESGGQTDPYYYAKSDAMGMGGAMATPQIQTGENEMRLDVTLVYEVK